MTIRLVVEITVPLWFRKGIEPKGPNGPGTVVSDRRDMPNAK
jgi:hypothetical protein